MDWSVLVLPILQVHPYSEAAAAVPPLVRPLPPAAQLAAGVSKAVVGWSRTRVREDNGGVERLLAEDAQVCLEQCCFVWSGILHVCRYKLLQQITDVSVVCKCRRLFPASGPLMSMMYKRHFKLT